MKKRGLFMNEWILNNLEWICPLIITILFSILNIIVAICNLRITKRQSRMQNDGFCFQLFERRHEIYEKINHALSIVVVEGKVRCKVFIWRRHV